MPLTKLSLAGNNLIIPGTKSLVSDIPAGDGKDENLFYRVYLCCMLSDSYPAFFPQSRRLLTKIFKSVETVNEKSDVCEFGDKGQ